MPDISSTVYIHGTVFVVAIITALAVRYPDRAMFDEYRTGIPFKKGWPLVGRLLHILKDRESVHEHFLECFTDLKSLTITSSSLGMPKSILTIDPKNIEHVLKDNFENYVKSPQLNDVMGEILGHGIFNANGERWKFQRKTASHIFNVKRFREHYTAVFTKELKATFENVINAAIDNQETIDFQDTMLKYTLNTFMLVGFGTEPVFLTKHEKLKFAVSFDTCQRNGFKRFVNPFWKTTELLSSIFMPWKVSIYQHVQTLHQFANTIVDERRRQIMQTRKNNQDLLSRFMVSHNEKGELLNNQELRDIILNFIIAGRDTTAQSLSWTFYMILLNPHVEETLLYEINRTISDDLIEKPELLYDAVKHMKYAHAILFEALRLYPVVPNNQKLALDDDIWPDGTSIKKGDYIYWCPWAQGRSEMIWGPDAKEFKPERWITLDNDLRRPSQGEWPAFHAGPRVCLGQQLAILQSIVTMVFIVKNYKLHLVPGQNITYSMSLTLPMKNGMKVYATKRK